MDPDQSAPVGTVRSGSTMFASMLVLNRHVQMAFQGLNNGFCVCTEVMAQDDTVAFE